MDSDQPAFTPEEVKARLGAMAMDLLLKLLPRLARAGVVDAEDLRSIVRIHELPHGMKVDDVSVDIAFACYALTEFADRIEERDRIAITVR